MENDDALVLRSGEGRAQADGWRHFAASVTI
jgi:hypothetical protein